MFGGHGHARGWLRCGGVGGEEDDAGEVKVEGENDRASGMGGVG